MNDEDFKTPNIVKSRPTVKPPSGSDYKFGSDLEIDIFDSKEQLKGSGQRMYDQPVDAPIPAIPTFMRKSKVKSSKKGSPDHQGKGFMDPSIKKKDPISKSLA